MQELTATQTLRTGDIVHVPPGWVHTVYTKAPCLKVAIEVFKWEHLEMYVQSWAGFATQHMASPHSPDDCMQVCRLLCKLVAEMH